MKTTKSSLYGKLSTFARRQLSWRDVAVGALAAFVWITDQAVARNGFENIPLISLPPWIAIVVAPLALGRHARWFYIPFFIIFILIEPVAVFVRVNFGMQLAGDWVGIVLCSSPSEMSWFFSQYFGVWAVLAVVGVLLAVSFAIWLSLGLKNSRITRTKAVFSLFAIFLFARLTSPWKSPRDTLETSSTIFLIMDSVSEWSHFHLLADMKNNPKFPNEMSVVSLRGVQGVFVMGESATRNRWGLYGYDKDTTPAMSSISNELAVFSDVVTHASTTAKAIEYILTTADIDNPTNLKFSLPQILRANGIDVSLISAQSRWGRYDGIEVFAFAGCDPMVFLGEQNLPEPWYDDACLPYIDNKLENQGTNSVIFLHLRGSHLPCELQYPPSAAFFKPEDIPHKDRFVATAPNQYDNSIRFTDKLLGAIVAKLKKKGGPAWMIYISDHGETPTSKSWRTATDRDLWEVPMIVWLSEEYKAVRPDVWKALRDATDKPLQSDQLLAGFLHVIGIQGCGVGTPEDFLSPTFKRRRLRKIENGRCIYPWEKISETGVGK